jgi:hypothetical protein
MPPKIGPAAPSRTAWSPDANGAPSQTGQPADVPARVGPAARHARLSGAAPRPPAGDSGASKRPRIRPDMLVQTHATFHDDGSQSVRRKLVVAHPATTSKGEPLGDAMTRALRGKELALHAHGGLAASDAHMHPTQYQQVGRTYDQALVKDMNTIGMQNTTIMSIPTTIISTRPDAQEQHQPAHHCGPAYYVPPGFIDLPFDGMDLDVMKTIVEKSGAELYLDTGVDASMAAQLYTNLSDLTHADRARLDPMITGLHLGDIKAGDQLLCKLAENKGVFTGIGEVTLAKELVDQMFAGSSQANVNENIEAFVHLAEVAGVVGMPIVMHCDVDSLQNQLEHRAHEHAHPAPCTPANLQGLKNLLDDPRLKDTTMIWAHAGGLGRFVAEPEGHTDELQAMLDKNKNLMIDISWSQVATQLTKSPEAMKRWEDFLGKNHERILFGSDTLAPKDAAKWNETRSLYTGLLDRLPIDKRANILNNNYQRVFVDSRQKVRNFEDKVLTPEFYRNDLKRDRERVINPQTLRDMAAA